MKWEKIMVSMRAPGEIEKLVEANAKIYTRPMENTTGNAGFDKATTAYDEAMNQYLASVEAKEHGRWAVIRDDGKEEQVWVVDEKWKAEQSANLQRLLTAQQQAMTVEKA